MLTCGRRSGKTTGIGRRFIRRAEDYPGVILPYIVQTRETAKEILWPPMIQLDRELQLGLAFKENTGAIHFPNGSRILLFGAGSRREMEKLRGFKFPEAAIDEAQLFPGSSLDYLLNQVIIWATADYGDAAQVIIAGTPNAASAGEFHKLWTEEKGSRHHWTMEDNPYMPNKKGGERWEDEQGRKEALGKWVGQLMKTRGWSASTPAFLREYQGLWVRDTTSLVYKADLRRAPYGNVVDGFFDRDVQPRADDWVFTLGMDFGVASASAYAVVAHSLQLGEAYVVEAFKVGGDGSAQPASRFAATLDRLHQKYDFAKKIGDFGGLGRPVVETLMHDYGIATEAARKTEKAAHIEFLNSDFMSHTFYICRPLCGDLLEEIELLQWAEESYETGIMKEQRGAPNHACDAMLYAWRGGVHKSLDAWEAAPPRPGTLEAVLAADSAAAERYAARHAQQDGNEPGNPLFFAEEQAENPWDDLETDWGPE